VPDLRLFVAVSLPPPVEDRVEVVLDKVSRYPEIKWASRSQFHVTLRFIGDFDQEKLPRLEQCLNEAATSFGPFEAEIKGLDAFPKLKYPKVLFAPITDGKESFTKLSRIISSRIQVLGIGRDDKDFRAHLTLGRVREKQNASAAIQALRESGLALGVGWKVNRFSLFQSRLTPEGAVHTRLKEFEFQG
jgi:RNA 2',3'-cyclic 3'-phosphodiesterase